MKRISSYFLEGLLFMVPVFLTLYIFYIVFIKVDGLLKIPIPGIGIIPGVGFLATILLITLVGFLVSNFLTKRLLLIVDRTFSRLPLVKLIYGSVKDLINAFAGDKKSFNKPVLVRLSSDDTAHVLGFITCASLEKFGLDNYVAVYVPQSYNFAGQLLIFPNKQIIPLQANSSDIMTFVVSGGIAGN